jgi:translation initiation factor 4E
MAAVVVSSSSNHHQVNNINGTESSAVSLTPTTAMTIPEGHHALQHSFVFWYMRRGKGSGSGGTSADPNGSAKKGAPPGVAPVLVDEGSIAVNVDNHANAASTSPADQPASPTAAAAATAGGGPPNNPYESSIKQIAAVHSVEEFWSIYDYLVRPDMLPTTTDLHFFRHGVKPTWEDSQNAKGGKWLIRLKKGLASRYWEELLLALLGQQLSKEGVKSEEICGVVISIRYSEDIISIWNKHATDRDATEKIRDGIKKVLRLPSHVHMEYKPHQTSLADKSSFRNTTVWKGGGAGAGGGRGGGAGRGGGGGHHIAASGGGGGDVRSHTSGGDDHTHRSRSDSMGERSGGDHSQHTTHSEEGFGGGGTVGSSGAGGLGLGPPAAAPTTAFTSAPAPAPGGLRPRGSNTRRSNSWGERDGATSTGSGSGTSTGNPSTTGNAKPARRAETERSWR